MENWGLLSLSPSTLLDSFIPAENFLDVKIKKWQQRRMWLILKLSSAYTTGDSRCSPSNQLHLFHSPASHQTMRYVQCQVASPLPTCARWCIPWVDWSSVWLAPSAWPPSGLLKTNHSDPDRSPVSCLFFLGFDPLQVSIVACLLPRFSSCWFAQL